MANERGMTIHFMDGAKLQVDFPKQVKSDEAVPLRLDKIITHQGLLVEADGALLMIPFANVRYLQVYPAPGKLPDYAIKEATLTGETS
jgi:hypothetical protein